MKSRTLNGNHGGILVFVAVCLLVLLGISALVVDLGRLYVAKQRAQNVADAAVLAAAWSLPVNPMDPMAVALAKAAAQDVASKNNAKTPHWGVRNLTGSPGVTVTIGPYTPGSYGPVDVRVKTECRVPIDYTFARALGFAQGSAYAKAVAVRSVQQQFTGHPFPWLVVVHQYDPPIKLGEKVTRLLYNPGDPALRNTPIPWRTSFIVLDLDKSGWPYADYQNARYAKRVRGNYFGAQPPLPTKLTIAVGTKLSFYGQGDTGSENLASATNNALAMRSEDYSPPQDSRTQPLCDGWIGYSTWRQGRISVGVWFDPPNLVLLPVSVVKQGDITPSTGGLIFSGYIGFFIEGFNRATNTVEGYFVSPTISGGVDTWSTEGDLASTIKLVE